MKEIVFQKGIYTKKSIELSCRAYEEYSDVNFKEKKDAYEVQITPKPNSPSTIVDEFTNYVIASLV